MPVVKAGTGHGVAGAVESGARVGVFVSFPAQVAFVRRPGTGLEDQDQKVRDAMHDELFQQDSQ